MCSVVMVAGICNSVGGGVLLPARSCASAVIAVIVCPSVRLSHAGIVSKRLNVGSRKQHRVIAQGL